MCVRGMSSGEVIRMKLIESQIGCECFVLREIERPREVPDFLT